MGYADELQEDKVQIYAERLSRYVDTRPHDRKPSARINRLFEMFLGKTENCGHLGVLDVVIRRNAIHNALRILFEEIVALLMRYPVEIFLIGDPSSSQTTRRTTFGSTPANGTRN